MRLSTVLLIAVLALPTLKAETIAEAFTRTVSVDFTDASLEDMGNFLEEALKPAINVVVDNPARAVTVDRMALEDANLLTILSLLLEMTPGLEVSISVGGAFMPITQLESLLPVDSEQFRSFAVGKRATVLLSGAKLKPGHSQTRVQVYNIGPLLQYGVEVEGLIAAIEAAGGTTSGADASAQYHESTKLLVCAGSAAKLAVIDQVIVQLDAGPEVVMQSLLMRQDPDSQSIYRNLAGGVSMSQKVREAHLQAEHLRQVNNQLREQITDLQQQLTELRLESEIAEKRFADDRAQLEQKLKEQEAEK
jgi:hypothetical protein